MPERALPLARVGTRESEAPAGYRRRFDLQGIGILYHRLPKRFLQGSSQKGISCCLKWWRKTRQAEGPSEGIFAYSDQSAREKAAQRSWRCVIFRGAQAVSLSFLRQHKKVEELRSTVANQEAIVAQQQKEFQATATRQEDKIQALTAALKKQAAQIEKVSAQIEVKDRTTQIVDNE
jgi:hypothetical protein